MSMCLPLNIFRLSFCLSARILKWKCSATLTSFEDTGLQASSAFRSAKKRRWPSCFAGFLIQPRLMATSTITANCLRFKALNVSWIYSRQNRRAWIILHNKHQWRRKGQEIGPANGCEVANVCRTAFGASSLTSTSFSKSAQWCQVAWDDPPFNEWRDYCKLIFHNLPSPSGKAQSGFAF